MACIPHMLDHILVGAQLWLSYGDPWDHVVAAFLSDLHAYY
jgi:hypothetical protein